MTLTHTLSSLRRMIIGIALLTMAAACNTTRTATNQQHAGNTQQQSADNHTLAFLRKTTDNAVYARHINAKADVSVDGKSLPVTTQMQTTQGKMIRLSLTALGLMEVGRLEMTPTDVLIIDRVHKQYARQTYDKVKFMAQNGLNFYTLEALLRNQLFLPGHTAVGEANIEQFTLQQPTAAQHEMTICHKAGNMDYTWTATPSTAQIVSTTIVLHDAKQGNSTLQWNYADFVSMGKKHYPTTHNIQVNIAGKKPRQRNMLIHLGKINTTTDYSAPTAPSSRYEEVDIDELFQSIFAQ